MRVLAHPTAAWLEEAEFLRSLRRSGFTIDYADSNSAVLQMIFVNPYDVVLLSLLGLTPPAIALLRSIRKTFQQWLFLRVRAASTEEERAQAFEAGADDLLEPRFVRESVTKVRALTAHCQSARPSAINVGDITIDVGSRLVTWRGIPIRLTAREYAVLLMLGSQAGTVVPRAELLDRIWDDNHSDSFHSLDVIISRLRGRLRPCAGPTIVTHRGLGYSLVGSVANLAPGQLDLFETGSTRFEPIHPPARWAAIR